jgi:hypothetical protein
MGLSWRLRGAGIKKPPEGGWVAGGFSAPQFLGRNGWQPREEAGMTDGLDNQPPPLQSYPGYKPEELALLDEFKDPDPRPEPDFVVDFVGTRIAADILWEHAGTLSGGLAGMPIPGDFHAETIEWIGVLKAVKAAGQRFAVLELILTQIYAARRRPLRATRRM